MTYSELNSIPKSRGIELILSLNMYDFGGTFSNR